MEYSSGISFDFSQCIFLPD